MVMSLATTQLEPKHHHVASCSTHKLNCMNSWIPVKTPYKDAVYHCNVGALKSNKMGRLPSQEWRTQVYSRHSSSESHALLTPQKSNRGRGGEGAAHDPRLGPFGCNLPPTPHSSHVRLILHSRGIKALKAGALVCLGTPHQQTQLIPTDARAHTQHSAQASTAIPPPWQSQPSSYFHSGSAWTAYPAAPHHCAPHPPPQ